MTTSSEPFFRFENDALQQALMENLDRAGVTYTRRADGAVVFAEANRTGVMDTVCRVRDTQFPWYLVKWPAETESVRYRVALTGAGLSFVVELQETGTWFVVRRQDEARHNEIREVVLN